MCFKCGRSKPLTEYYKHKQMADGHLNKCKDCTKRDVRLDYHSDPEKHHERDRQRQRYSRKRIFDHRYKCLLNRVGNKIAGRTYASSEHEVLTREQYDAWLVKNMDQFERIYTAWVESGFDRKLSPSIDRIKNNKGYVPENMQWLSLSNNNKKSTK